MPPSMQTGFAGFILAGGRSQRFGSDKALAVFRGRPLICYPIAALREIGISPAIVAPHADRYREWCAEAVTSERPGLGPIEGVRAALLASSSGWAFILSVDMPLVGPGLLEALRSRAESLPRLDAICFVDSKGRRHPFPGLYNRSLIALFNEPEGGEEAAPASARGGLAGAEFDSPLQGDGSMQSLLDAARAEFVGPRDVVGSIDLEIALLNVNRSADFPI